MRKRCTISVDTERLNNNIGRLLMNKYEICFGNIYNSITNKEITMTYPVSYRKKVKTKVKIGTRCGLNSQYCKLKSNYCKEMSLCFHKTPFLEFDYQLVGLLHVN